MKSFALVVALVLLAASVTLAADVVMESVDSSLIGKVGYDAETETLAVQMCNSTDVYTYKDVPKSVYDEFLASESIGAYYVENIKGQYESE